MEKIKYSSVKEGLLDLKEKTMAFKQVMEARLKDDNLWNTWIDTRTFILYGEKGKFKITNNLDFEILKKEINKNGSVSISKEIYDNCKDKEFSAKDIKLNELLTPKEALSHKGWLALCEGDKKLLKNYVDKAKEKDCFDDNGKGMSFYINLENENFEVRPWYFGGSGGGSDADDRYVFGDSGRFLRVEELNKLQLLKQEIVNEHGKLKHLVNDEKLLKVISELEGE